MIDKQSRCSQWGPPTILVLTMVMAALAYWTGLDGPFLLDDDANLHSIPEWLRGDLGLATLLFERGAGMFGRPLSMATLALNAWLLGYSPHAFKVGNLITHLACGLVIFCFLRQLLRRDPRLQSRAPLIAVVVATLWLLHPLHASTVLYAVQRMAQISTLFTLLGLWLYLAARERLERGTSTTASALLLLGMPVVTVIAFLGKENGALLPLLCAAIEVFWFSGQARPRPVRWFHGIYVVLPVLSAVIALLIRPERFVGGFAGRDFSLTERLLTQPRALSDYLWKLVVPNPPTMGVYTDDFPLSIGLMAPPTTLVAILFLLLLSAVAWHWRKALPAVAFGWFFFLTAHALEAGILPLELYFEHRNYLPSIGILLALTALAAAMGRRLASQGLHTQRIGIVLTAGVILVLAMVTHGRARVWQSEALIAESSLLAHPHSLRANVAVMTTALQRGDRARGSEALQRILESENPRHRALGHAYRLMIECELDHKGRPEDLEYVAANTPFPLTTYEQQPFDNIIRIVHTQPCAPFDNHDFAGALIRIADRAQAAGKRSGNHGYMRYLASAFLVRARDWEAALPQARLAWGSDTKPDGAAPLALAQLHMGDIAGAERTLLEATRRSTPDSKQEQENLKWLREQIENARRDAAPRVTSPTPTN
jgi:hypothetical protein